MADPSASGESRPPRDGEDGAVQNEDRVGDLARFWRAASDNPPTFDALVRMGFVKPVKEAR